MIQPLGFTIIHNLISPAHLLFFHFFLLSSLIPLFMDSDFTFKGFPIFIFFFFFYYWCSFTHMPIHSLILSISGPQIWLVFFTTKSMTKPVKSAIETGKSALVFWESSVCMVSIRKLKVHLLIASLSEQMCN